MKALKLKETELEISAQQQRRGEHQGAVQYAKGVQLMLPKFIDGEDEMDAYLRLRDLLILTSGIRAHGPPI